MPQYLYCTYCHKTLPGFHCYVQFEDFLSNVSVFTSSALFHLYYERMSLAVCESSNKCMHSLQNLIYGLQSITQCFENHFNYCPEATEKN